jgi:hypothetical protein
MPALIGEIAVSAALYGVAAALMWGVYVAVVLVFAGPEPAQIAFSGLLGGALGGVVVGGFFGVVDWRDGF